MAFTNEQRRNAATIVSVGRQVGASPRDILIALMVAMQESSLRNLGHGHLDSVGIFQQRTRGWASRSIRMDPAQSARMFFLGGYGGAPGLFDKKNRDRMSLSQAAQAVQVSAFPSAYAKWEDEARSLMGMAPGKAVGGGGGKAGGSMGRGGWVRPVRNGVMTQEYGRPNSGYAAGHHTGIDYGVPNGTPVYAAASGKVVKVTSGGAYGTRIEIEHNGKLWTLYAHLSAASVRVGQTVNAGQLIGKSGDTGNSSGPHLHFEVRAGANKYGNTVNPMTYLNGSTTPSAYLGDTVEEFDTSRPLSTTELLGLGEGSEMEKIGLQLSKPYVYMNPIDMMTAPNIPVGSSIINEMSSGPLPEQQLPDTAVEKQNGETDILEPEMI